MTEFQKYYKDHPRETLEKSFEKFKEMYPGLSIEEQKKEFGRQISQFFFS